jgi:hypothetical protein
MVYWAITIEQEWGDKDSFKLDGYKQIMGERGKEGLQRQTMRKQDREEKCWQAWSTTKQWGPAESRLLDDMADKGRRRKGRAVSVIEVWMTHVLMSITHFQKIFSPICLLSQIRNKCQWFNINFIQVNIKSPTFIFNWMKYIFCYSVASTGPLGQVEEGW